MKRAMMTTRWGGRF